MWDQSTPISLNKMAFQQFWFDVSVSAQFSSTHGWSQSKHQRDFFIAVVVLLLVIKLSLQHTASPINWRNKRWTNRIYNHSKLWLEQIHPLNPMVSKFNNIILLDMIKNHAYYCLSVRWPHAAILIIHLCRVFFLIIKVVRIYLKIKW